MPRTTENAVRDVIDTDPNVSLAAFISAAGVIVDRVVACAAKRGYTHTAAELGQIETWLAAWYYAVRKPRLASRSTSTGGGSASGSHDKPNEYKAAAVALDASGCLNAILSGQRAGTAWLGRPPSEQTAYADRD